MANRVQLAFKYIFSASFRCAFTKTVCIRNWKAASTCWCQSLIEPWLKYLSRSLWCPWETRVRLNTLLPPTLKFTCNQAWLPNNQETYCWENEIMRDWGKHILYLQGRTTIHIWFGYPNLASYVHVRSVVSLRRPSQLRTLGRYRDRYTFGHELYELNAVFVTFTGS